jgi:hypothetical protein
LRPGFRRFRRLALLLLTSAALAPEAEAQDSHYWSIQYGPVAQLVGGQVIGGVPDLSATFYNPGAVALRNEKSYLLSTESVQLESVSTQSDSSVKVFDTSSSRFGAAPSLLAGTLPRWLGEDTHLAWSFLTRQKLDVRLGERLTNSFPSPFTRSATESYFDQRMSETWAGLTVSRPVSESVGVGLTGYGVYRGQRTRKELSAQAVGADNRSLAASGVSDFDFSHCRMLAKLGVAWQGNAWNAGLSVTTPSLGLFGSGKLGYTLSLSGVDANGDGRIDPPVLETAAAEGLATDYRSSWAIGAGASRRWRSTRLYASAEWFAPVGRFTVLAPPDGSAQEGLTQELRGVLNAGLGVEHAFRDDLSLYGAFHTDFSASVGAPSANVAVSDWDLYHLSGGVSFRMADNRFTLGASWAFGGKTRALDSPLPPGSVPGSGLDSDFKIHYSRITFLLGFVFGS